MSRRLPLFIAWMALVIIGLLLVLDLAYFIHGSLEMFPTEERQAGSRLASGAVAVVLGVVEIGLWLLVRALRRRVVA